MLNNVKDSVFLFV